MYGVGPGTAQVTSEEHAAMKQTPEEIGARLAAEVAAMSPEERAERFPVHSDGQVCR
jgi:hypothetical protein